MVFRGLEVVFKIYSYILDRMKDYRLSKSKLAKLILEYSIVLSIFIIIIGFYVVYSSIDRTTSNFIYIQTPDEKNSSIYSILIDIEYKEPLNCGGDLKITGIEMMTFQGVKYKDIKNVSLNVDIHGKELGISNTQNFINLNLNSGKVISTTSEIFPETELIILTFDQYIGNLLRSDQDSYDTFNIKYYLSYNSIDKTKYMLSGNGTTKFPINCMDYVTQTNIYLNKSILKLTGFLIILGSIPFVASLRQLLNGKKY